MELHITYHYLKIASSGMWHCIHLSLRFCRLTKQRFQCQDYVALSDRMINESWLIEKDSDEIGHDLIKVLTLPGGAEENHKNFGQA
jgi:hypothetical protein